MNQRWAQGRDSYRPAGEPIQTRLYEVAELDELDAKAFVVEHHYSRSYPAARWRFGLHRAGRLVGVAVFSGPYRYLLWRTWGRGRRVFWDLLNPSYQWIMDAARRCDLIVCAWGNHGRLHRRGVAVAAMLLTAGLKPQRFGMTALGQPAHPLYLPRAAFLRPLSLEDLR